MFRSGCFDAFTPCEQKHPRPTLLLTPSRRKTMKSRLVASTNRCQFPALLCAIVAGSMCSIASAQSVTRESVSGTNSPVEGNGVSREAAISADAARRPA